MKTLLLAFFVSATAMAQDTGAFSITTNNFKDLFNQHRVAQPKITPWAGSFFPYGPGGTAVKLDKNGNEDSQGKSPMMSYGALAKIGSEAHDWELENHSCKNFTGEMKESCESWWGHCNGWSAAAIKELEPRKGVKVGSREFTVAEQKAILSELWLSSASLNAGWTDKNIKTDKWVHDHDRPTESYRMFWDVSPRSFFLIFTNYVGAQKTGVVIDRFTGDEVWNQPVVGYRILPIEAKDITKVSEGRSQYWSVLLKMKVFWANDLGTPPGHISKTFDIKKMSDDEDVDYVGDDYEGRLLKFRLKFDAEVKVSADGKQVLSAGKMVGDGIWDHQENSRDLSDSELNSTHPDFIWLPTDPIQDFSGYGNPHMDEKVVAQLTRAQGATTPTATAKNLKLVFAPRVFGEGALTEELVKREIAKVIRREGIRHAIYLADISISRSRVSVIVKFPQGVNEKALVALFKAAEMPVRIE